MLETLHVSHTEMRRVVRDSQHALRFRERDSVLVLCASLLI